MQVNVGTIQGNSPNFRVSIKDNTTLKMDSDLRVNTVREDPDRFFYITKNIILENPATSLEVIIDGYVPDVCDLRVFYAVNQDKELDDVIFTPFPGYKNLDKY